MSIAEDAFRTGGSLTPRQTPSARRRGRPVAATRIAAWTLANRVRMVDGCNPLRCMSFTHNSTCDFRRSVNGKCSNVHKVALTNIE
jgi:hypothetical protein